MTVPGWWELVLLSLAAWRTWALIAYDKILDRPRSIWTKSTQEWLACPYCSGFWVALGWWAAWQLWPHGTLIVAGAVALAALVPMLERLSGD